MAVTGGLRTTPTDVLDMHAHLLPIHLEIDKICHRAATRIATLPPDHPLYKPARKCANHNVKRHKSPLHILMQTYNVRPQDTESIKPATRNPACHALDSSWTHHFFSLLSFHHLFAPLPLPLRHDPFSYLVILYITHY